MVQYFHGRHSTRVQGYRGTTEFEMFFAGTGIDDQEWSNMLNDLSNDVTWVIDFDPENPGIRTGIYVLADSEQTHAALITGKIRNRSVKTKWVTTRPLAQTPPWLSSATIPEPEFILLDPTDLLLFLPESLSVSGTTLVKWENLGSTGIAANLDGPPDWADQAGLPADCTVDPTIGRLVAGITDTKQVASTYPSDNLVQSIIGTNDDSEMWIVVKIAAGATNDDLFEFSTNSIGRLSWRAGNRIQWVIGATDQFINAPTGYNDGTWHLIRTIHNLSNNQLSLEVDGIMTSAKAGFSTAISFLNLPIAIFNGRTASASNIGTEIGMIKMTDGIFTQARSRSLKAHFRDTWNISNIPPDGTVTGIVAGLEFHGDNLRNVPVGLTNRERSFSIWNPGVASDVGWGIDIDHSLEHVYAIAGGATKAGVTRTGYGGQDTIAITITEPNPSALGKSLALDMANEMMYVTAGVAGNVLSSHTTNAADFTVPWVELIAAGTYEMNSALVFNPDDGLLYFIDSLAATPTLRTVTAAGANDTLVKSLTPGKTYQFMAKDPDNDHLYFSNQTDGTIEKYDISSGVHTLAWITPANIPFGLDIFGGKLYYIQDTDHLVFMVTISSPSAGVQIADYDFFLSPTAPRGIAVTVFDSTLT